MSKESERPSFAIRIPWGTIFKVFAACLLAFIAIKLSRFIALLLISLVIAIAFRPLLQWIARHRWPRWTGVFVCGLILFGTAGIIFGMIVPVISSQGMGFLEKLPTFKEDTLQRLPSRGPLRNIADQIFSATPFSNPQPLLEKAVTWGSAGLERIAEFLIVLVLALYLVADGERVYHWLVAFLPPPQRPKVAEAADGITSVVGRYVAGNLLTSLLCGIYAYIVLRFLHVPGAALLAVLAGVFDLLPVIGFFLFTIPAALAALTVSLKTAVLVIALYIAYDILENYLIVPKVYGNRLRLSELTVLISCVAAGWIGGVIGILLVLPMVACYPIVERIWLRPYLQPDTVNLHEESDAEKPPKAK